jgi:putative ATP-binding cassette transporter
MLRIPVNEQGWGLFLSLLRQFAASPWGPKAIRLFLLLNVLLVGVNVLNIINSYVGRDFMTAISARNSERFTTEGLLYLLVFAASTLVAVWLRFSEERLGLVWRDFMTRRFLDLYVCYPTYYRLNDPLIRNSGVEYPDQRIAEDVRVFTVTTLSFALMTLNGLFTVLAFSGVLWSISPWLLGVALGYAGVGSYFTVRLGSPLVDLNDRQLDREASFRSGLLHVRDRAESVALLHREGRILPRLNRQFDEVVQNFRRIVQVNRNLGFFTTGYNYLVQIIPIVLVAPLFIRGDVEFGVVTQSAMAFSMLVGAFSLIVTQFQSISSYAAVIQRLISLWYAIEMSQSESVSGLVVREDDNQLAYENLTLRSSADGHVLLKDLSIVVPYGTRVLISGEDEVTIDALFKATEGIYDSATGSVIRPPLDRIMFLPERAYLPPGTLRQNLIPAEREGTVADERILDAIHALGLENVVARAGGLDIEHEWDSLLSLHEQRSVSLARILLADPGFAVLHNPFRGLDANSARRMLGILDARGITYVTIGHEGHRVGENPPELYDAVLELEADGSWGWKPAGMPAAGGLKTPVAPAAPPKNGGA